jgi:hypothetical protein
VTGGIDIEVENASSDEIAFVQVLCFKRRQNNGQESHENEGDHKNEPHFVSPAVFLRATDPTAAFV